jgi:radical SAM protein with 4Fe4S-binding SPASM domain
MYKRFLFRAESSIGEPIDNPVRSILMDREIGRYYLLDKKQTKMVSEAMIGHQGEIHSIIQTSPFRVNVNLGLLAGNIDFVNNESKRVDILSAPISAYLEISAKCNLNCVGCYQGQRKESKSMTTSQILGFLNSFARFGGLTVRLTGKEPTMHKDIVKVVSAGSELGLKLAMNTNGVFPERKIAELVHAGLSEVVISLDGDSFSHNLFRGAEVYERTIATAENFSSLGVDTRFNMTVSPLNMSKIGHVAEVAKKYNAYVSYIPLRNIGKAAEGVMLTMEDMKKVATEITHLRKELGIRLLTYFDIFGDEPDYYHPMFQLSPCHARKNIFVTYDGNVFPCDHLVPLGKIYCGGNILESDLRTIWNNGAGLERYRKIGISDECINCQFFLSKCYGGCISEAVTRLGKNCGQKIERDRLCPRSLV